jgi:uncharacterized protein YjbJ (UPF0337 family)
MSEPTMSAKADGNGLLDKAKGTAGKVYGKARDAVSSAAGAAKAKASSMAVSVGDAAKGRSSRVKEWLRSTGEAHPTGVIIGTFVLGMFFGGFAATK